MGDTGSRAGDTMWELGGNCGAGGQSWEMSGKQWGPSSGGWGGHEGTGITFREGTEKAQGSCPRDTGASEWGALLRILKSLTAFPSCRYSRSPGAPRWRGQEGTHSTGGHLRTLGTLGLQTGGPGENTGKAPRPQAGVSTAAEHWDSKVAGSGEDTGDPDWGSSGRSTGTTN